MTGEADRTIFGSIDASCEESCYSGGPWLTPLALGDPHTQPAHRDFFFRIWIHAMKEAIIKFLRDEEGLTIVEYAVAAGLITLIVVTAFSDLGKEVLRIIEGITTDLKGDGGGGGGTTP